MVFMDKRISVSYLLPRRCARELAFYDGTYQYLKSLGIQVIP